MEGAEMLYVNPRDLAVRLRLADGTTRDVAGWGMVQLEQPYVRAGLVDAFRAELERPGQHRGSSGVEPEKPGGLRPAQRMGRST
jgi:hypothetical protein